MKAVVRLVRPCGLLLSACLGVAIVSCSSEERIDGFSSAEWAVINTLSPLPDAPADPTNEYSDDPAAAAFGQRIFFEKRHSGPLQVASDLGEVGDTGRVGCATCHVPSAHFDDNRSTNNVSVGFQFTPRNTPSLINAVFYDFYGWGGKQDSLWTQASLSPESMENAGGDRCGYSRIMWRHHKEYYEDVFGPLPERLDPDHPEAFPDYCRPGHADWEALDDDAKSEINAVMANCGKAIAAYEQLLVSGNSPFDEYVAGDHAALTASQKRGLRLFIGKAACVTCHSGPAFTDNDFHNLGVPQVGSNVPAEDLGRFADINVLFNHQFNTASEWSADPEHGAMRHAEVEATDDLRGAFRTKALRGVAHTAPYFHTGHVATLREVMEFYNDGGGTSGFAGTKSALMRPLNLTSQEMDDLVAFMLALTGDPIPTHLTENPMPDLD